MVQIALVDVEEVDVEKLKKMIDAWGGSRAVPARLVLVDGLPMLDVDLSVLNVSDEALILFASTDIDFFVPKRGKHPSTRLKNGARNTKTRGYDGPVFFYDLISRTVHELLRIKNFGRKSLNELGVFVRDEVGLEIGSHGLIARVAQLGPQIEARIQAVRDGAV